MADQYSDNDTAASRDDSLVYDSATDTALNGNRDNVAYPNHGIDGRSGDDAAKGGVLGAVGGAVVGGLAGGPIGALIGGVAGGIASDAGVAAVDHVDHDNSPGENNNARYGAGGYDNGNLGNRNVDAVIDVNRDYADSAYASRNSDFADDDAITTRSNYVPASASTINSGIDNSAEYDANGNRIR